MLKPLKQNLKKNAHRRSLATDDRAVFDNAPDIIFEIHPGDWTITSLNPAFEKNTGWQCSQWIGRRFYEILYPGDLPSARNIVNQAQNGKRSTPLELSIVKPSGDLLTVEFILVPVSEGPDIITAFGYARDITEQKNLENQLLQKQKMEAIGTLAGGIAHDFNNFLMTIMMNTEFAYKKLHGNTLVQESLDMSLKAACRARDLVEQILTFSRKGEKELCPLTIYPIVKESLKMLRSVLPVTVEIRQDLKAQEAQVLANPSQVQQVLINLCSNAAFAMRENGGVLTVRLEEAVVDFRNDSFHADIQPGRPYLKLTVSDTGHGMTYDIIERIFEPFFTTKKTGEGTGMGLSMVHGIIKGVGGAILVDSTPGKGSTFEVFMPKIESAEQSVLTPALPSPSGMGKLLVVDDEEFLLKSLQAALRYFGYQVVGSTCSIQALEIFKQDPEQFDLVITDQTMPKMTGINMAREILSIRSDIPVILCTGFSEEVTVEQITSVGICEFVMKPVSTSELAEVIYKALKKSSKKPE